MVCKLGTKPLRVCSVQIIFGLGDALSLMACLKMVVNRPFYSCGSVTRPMNGSEAAGDFVLIQSSLLFLCKCRLVSIATTQFT